MKRPLGVTRMFLIVVVGALLGMALGGGFGDVAGRIAPDLFTHVVSGETFEPVGTAAVLGAAEEW